MIARYLAHLRATSRPMHARRLRELYGDAVVDALVSERILVDAGVADWYPCGGHCHQRRTVLEERDKRAVAFVAPCAIDHGCDDARLSQADLQMLATDLSRVLDVLRRLHAIDASREAPEVIDDVVFLGQLGPRATQGALRADVFVALAPDEEALALFLATRTSARRETVVLHADPRLVSTRASSVVGTARVHALALEELIAIDGGRIVVTQDLEAALQPNVVGGTVAVLVSHDGERTLTKDEYDTLVETAAELFDLFLDVAMLRRVGRKKFFRGVTRLGAGHEETELTEGEAAAVAEFIVRARSSPVAAEALASVKDKSSRQLLKTGWKKVDDSRQFIVSERDGYVFRPAPGTRWALILPPRG